MKKSILIADDDSGIIEVLQIVLEQAGFKVLVAQNSSEVLKYVRTLKPVLILLDIWLAGENGAELAKTLKSKKTTKNIPIIMISANNNVEKMAKEAGADGFIAKPFDIDFLVEVVRKYVKKD